MKTLVILFYGLMIHVNQPWSLSNTVVIPKVDKHATTLRIPENSLLKFGDFQWIIDNSTKDGHVYVLPLTKRKVRIEGTRGMFLDRRANWVDAAPPLKTLAPTCRLRDEVRNREITDDLIAYVDYRAGRLTPDSYFSDQLKFENTDSQWKNSHCVPCTTRYEADLDTDYAELEIDDAGTKHSIRIAGNSQLMVTNLPTETVQFGHFDHNFAIFKNCSSHATAKKGDRCTNTPGCPPPPTPFPDADCTNSAYP